MTQKYVKKVSSAKAMPSRAPSKSPSRPSPPPPPPPSPAPPKFQYFTAECKQKTINELKSLLSSNIYVGVHWQFHDATLVTLTIVWPKTLNQAPWIFHVSVMKPNLVHEIVETIFEDSAATKIVYALHNAVCALSANASTQLTPSDVLDLELFYEHHVNPSVRDASILTIAQHCVKGTNLLFKEALTQHLERDRDAWTRPLLSHKLLNYTVECAQLYLACYEQFIQSKYNNAERAELCGMTTRRWQYAFDTQGERRIWFDEENDRRTRSLECLGTVDRVHQVVPALQLQCELASLLALLPSRFRDVITGIDDYQHRLVDVCLDVGRIPCVYTGPRERVALVSAEDVKVEKGLVSMEELTELFNTLGGEGKIGDDNRAGIDRQLHRISVMRSKTQEIYGLTLRVGRTLMHASNMLLDLLLSEEHRQKSVLFLGRPGSGKTTLIRDVTRCISESGENVCIIDTSNEIGGDGLVPHPCIGWARRMMVRSLDEQASVMVECVQNHTVETLVVDEIGRKNEVLAAGTVRQRGPRLIASAHGDFRSLIRNSDLKGLIGGVQSVTVGDAEAKKKPGLGKVQSQRSGAPIFDVIVELDEVCRGRCRIIWNVANAVDDVLSGQPYAYETREQSTKYRGVQVPPREAKQ